MPGAGPRAVRFFGGFGSKTATWRSGYATVCKTVYSGSIPDVASNSLRRHTKNCIGRLAVAARGLTCSDKAGGPWTQRTQTRPSISEEGPGRTGEFPQDARL